MSEQKKHIVEVLLKYVGVKFSNDYFHSILYENPISNSYLGIKTILIEYNIQSKTINANKLTASEKYESFITLYNSNFVIVTDYNNDLFYYLDEYNNPNTATSDSFIKNSSEFILVYEVTNESKEPKFVRNYIIGLFKRANKVLPLFLIVVGGIIFLNHLKLNLFQSLLLILYILGLIFSVILFCKSLGVGSYFINKVCENGKMFSCLSVLESDAATVLGLISWSEIGVIYFATNILSFTLIEESIYLLYALSSITLLYTIWSIYYQWMIIKKWCKFCLFIQLIFWCIFIIYTLNISFTSLYVDVNMVFSLILLFLTAIIITINARIVISKYITYNNSNRELMQIKSNDSVFSTLLSNEPNLLIDMNARRIVFGNEKANNVITFVNNPSCGHCASLFSEISQLLNKIGTDVKLEVIFIGDSHLEKSIKTLISIYFNYDKENSFEIYKKWYTRKLQIKEYYKLPYNEESINTIYNAQNQWMQLNNENYTPILYYNNTKVPSSYNIKDLIYHI